jgi:hypothetical protein
MSKINGVIMGQRGTMVKKAESLRGDAVRWLDKNLNGKTFSQRYEDAGKLLQAAGNARSKLEYSFPKDMKLSGQIAKERAKLYTHYKDAIAELTADVEDALQQMKKLRGAFLTSESAGQRAEYDSQIKKLKIRLDDLREYAKWVPADLRRREYREADAAIAAALSPASVPRKSALSARERKEIRTKRDEVAAEMKELKSKRAAAKSPAKKATLARAIYKLRTTRDKLKSRLEAPIAETAVAVAPKKKEPAKKAIAKVGMPKKKDHEMVFTEAEVEKFDRKQQSMAEQEEMFAAIKKARALTKEMAARRKAGKSLAGVRRKRFEAFARYVELGGNPERVPVDILKAMIKEGKRMG